jgi:hypothetical protein
MSQIWGILDFAQLGVKISFRSARPNTCKVLQTACGFPRETRRPFAAPKSNGFTLKIQVLSLAICSMLWHEKLLFEPAIMTCEISVLQACKFIATTVYVIVDEM